MSIKLLTVKPENNLPPAKPIGSSALLEILKKGKTLLIAGRPIDGDSLASAIALKRTLHSLKLKADVACGDRIPESLMFLPDIDEVIFSPDFLQYENFIVLDCGELRLTGYVDQLVKILKNPGVGTVINIDHHLQDPTYGHLSHIDQKAAATGLIVYRLIKQWGAEIDSQTATALLTTLYHDTGSFQHSNVQAEVLHMASECVRFGADAASIAAIMYRKKPLSILRLWGRVLERIEYRPEHAMVVSVITQDDLQQLDVAPDEVSGIVNILAHVPECRFALLLTEEEPNLIKGSLRSDEDKDTDVARIARLLGGGGHRLASGFRMQGRLEKINGRYRVV